MRPAAGSRGSSRIPGLSRRDQIRIDDEGVLAVFDGVAIGRGRAEKRVAYAFAERRQATWDRELAAGAS